MDETRDTPIHHIAIRVAAPPAVSAVLPLAEIQRRLEEVGLIVLGISSSRENDAAESDPSVLP